MESHHQHRESLHEGSQHEEAEDRDLPMTDDYPKVQTSSFDDVCFLIQQSSQTRQQQQQEDHELSLEYDPAFPYNEHHRQNSFKPRRGRSISEHFATSYGQEDSSFQNDQHDRSLLLDKIELELDFDQLDDLKDDVAGATLFEVLPTIPLTEEPISNDQNVFDGERDSCCGTEQQHDNALDSTFQSWHEEMSLDADAFSFEHSLDSSSVAGDSSIFLHQQGATEMLIRQPSIFERKQSTPSLVLINTCEPHVQEITGTVEQHLQVPSADLLDFSMDDSEAQYWGVCKFDGAAVFQSQQQNNTIAREDQMTDVFGNSSDSLVPVTPVTIDVCEAQLDASSCIRAPLSVVQSVHDSTTAEASDSQVVVKQESLGSTLAQSISSEGGVAAKIKKTEKIASKEATVANEKQNSPIAPKMKMIQKAPKMTTKKRLETKRGVGKTSHLRKTNLVAFNPHSAAIEEGKVGVPMAHRPKKGDRDYYLNFDFAFKRACFRTMTLYFKTAYKPFFDKWKSGKRKSTIMESLVAFANQEFPGLLNTMSEKAKFEFIELLKLLVLSHRHNKNDDFLKDTLIDFSIVREPMYKYSKQAQDKFFNFATFAFLFRWYEASPQGRAFASEKFAENSDPRYPARMTVENAKLTEEAQESLKRIEKGQIDQSQATYKSFMGRVAVQKMAKLFQNYFDTHMTTQFTASGV